MNITSSKDLIDAGKEKEAINFILENCFRAGFGALSKTDLDLILFSAILKFGEEVKTNDHDLSKYLQITQQRIRNLKEKASVKYLMITREEAIKRFTEKAASAKPEDIFLDIPIFDIAVKNEIEAILDENNILLYSQLNWKIFRLRIDDFLELSILFETEAEVGKSREETEEKIMADIRKLVAENEEFQKNITAGENKIAELSKKALKDALVKGGISFGIDLLASLVPGGTFVSGPVKKLLTTIAGKV